MPKFVKISPNLTSHPLGEHEWERGAPAELLGSHPFDEGAAHPFDSHPHPGGHPLHIEGSHPDFAPGSHPFKGVLGTGGESPKKVSIRVDEFGNLLLKME